MSFLLNDKRYAKNIGEKEESHYLTYFTVDIKVTSSTQHFALAFLCTNMN